MPSSLRVLLLAGLLLVVPPAPATAAERCPGAETTLALRECLSRLLERSDRELARVLAAVAAEASREPGGFTPLWRSFVEAHAGGQDPAAQLRTFQSTRRQLCRFTHSMSLQGSGFGLFVSSCELDLNDSLLRQLRN